MIQATPFEENIERYEAWFEKYPHIYRSEILAIEDHLQQLPENIKGIEIGLGTGRYAKPLGIKEGIEPSRNMREIAMGKGIDVMNARAEQLPYKDLHFDFALFVTICHLDNVHKALKEAHRVIKRNGSLILAFIDRDSPVGQTYEQNEAESEFYRSASFYSIDKLKIMLKEVGFKNPIFTQTLFNGLSQTEGVEVPRDGYGEGSFVVIRASK